MIKKRLLHVTAPYFCAGAVYEREAGEPWRCTQAAPILGWLVGMSTEDARERLERVRYQWEWTDTETK